MANPRRTLAVLAAVSLCTTVSLAESPARGAAPKPTPYLTAVTGAPLREVVIDGTGHAYATNPTQNRVEVIDLATGVLESPIAVGTGPEGLDLSADGSKLYVANGGGHDVSVVDVAQRQEM